VKPILKRKSFAFFYGSIWGTGWLTRKVLIESDNIFIQQKENVYLGRFFNNSDYMTTIANTKFCMLVRGTTGYASRMVDVIYAGCIPVFINMQGHFAFMDMLDF
jgi:hypothetical protein